MTMGIGGGQEPTRAMESCGAELPRQEGMIADETAPSERSALTKLRDFAEENPDLDKLEGMIEEQRSEFDALAFLDLWRREDFHSKILAWLLDPRGSHGAKGQFLRSFLLGSAAAATTAGISTIEPNDGPTFNWSATEVKQEWRNVVDGYEGRLDILLLNPVEGFVCAVENKVFSSEHSEQLTRYRRALKMEYPDFHSHHVFLSPRGTLPYREEEQQYWTPMTYATVLGLVEQTIADNSNPVSEDVGSFLRQYSTTLRRRIVADANTNLRQLARNIYLEHREAVEMLIENKPDFVAEGKEIFKAAVTRQDNWKLDWEERQLLFFRSVDWDRFEASRTGTGWGSGSLVTFGFDFRPGLPHLICTLGPGTDEAIRWKMHEAISQHRELFSRAGDRLATSYTRLDVKGPILDDADYGKWDDPAVRNKMMEWVSAFAERDFPAMNEVIVQCLRGYEGT